MEGDPRRRQRVPDSKRHENILLLFRWDLLFPDRLLYNENDGPAMGRPGVKSARRLHGTRVSESVTVREIPAEDSRGSFSAISDGLR